MKEWYSIDNIGDIDTPALILYPDRVKENIRILLKFVPDVSRLRPHVKTNKSAGTSALMIQAGITKFKCATIAEAEMLAIAGAKDVLLAYQPVGPKVIRLRSLVEKYASTVFSCLIDNIKTASDLSTLFDEAKQPLNVFIDLNVGMNRTGITPSHAFDLYAQCRQLKGIHVQGLHAYDGNIRDSDLIERTRRCDESYAPVDTLRKKIESAYSVSLIVVAGGTPTFPIHAKRKDVECSPGTFIYWDIGYQRLLPDEPFVFAALVVARIISKPASDTFCVDLGHKAIGSENPIDSRVVFLNAPDLQPIGHSEEHLVVRTAKPNSYSVGDVLYGVPFHICPTCALYDSSWLAENHIVKDQWSITSRKRTITI